MENQVQVNTSITVSKYTCILCELRHTQQRWMKGFSSTYDLSGIPHKNPRWQRNHTMTSTTLHIGHCRQLLPIAKCFCNWLGFSFEVSSGVTIIMNVTGFWLEWRGWGNFNPWNLSLCGGIPAVSMSNCEVFAHSLLLWCKCLFFWLVKKLKSQI